MPPCHQHEEEKILPQWQSPEGNYPDSGTHLAKSCLLCLPTRKRNLPVMMDEARSYLEKRQKQDDGSQDQTSKDQSEPVWVPERLTRRVPASEDGENHKQTNVPDADNHDGDADPQDDSRTPMGDSVGVPETTANQTFCSSFP